MKFFFFLFACPYLTASKICLLYSENFNSDLDACLLQIDRFSKSRLSPLLIEALYAAEDHRNHIHYGVDPIAIIRILYLYSKKKRQGGSTVEQQLVRVATNRYDRRITRKIREQLLAVTIVSLRPKKQIATAYLCSAYYGTKLKGLDGIKRLAADMSDITLKEAVAIVSRLKYPEPRKQSLSWLQKHQKRNAYILKRLKKS